MGSIFWDQTAYTFCFGILVQYLGHPGKPSRLLYLGIAYRILGAWIWERKPAIGQAADCFIIDRDAHVFIILYHMILYYTKLYYVVYNTIQNIMLYCITRLPNLQLISSRWSLPIARVVDKSKVGLSRIVRICGMTQQAGASRKARNDAAPLTVDDWNMETGCYAHSSFS